MRTIIVVGNNAKLLMQIILCAYVARNTRSIVIGGEAGSEIRKSKLCHEYILNQLDLGNEESFISTVNAISEKYPDSVLIPADCDGIRITNRVTEKLKIKIIDIPDPQTLAILDDKWNFYNWCISHKFATPKTIHVASKWQVDFSDVVEEIGLPFMLKPLDQNGSVGIHIIRSKKYFADEILADESFQYAPLILQRFIPGTDGGLSMFSLGGKLKAFAIQEYVPQGIRFISNDYLEKAATEFCAAIGYNGVINIDVRLEEKTGAVYFTEANPRFWASTFAAAWAGINFVEASLLAEMPPGSMRILTSGRFQERRHPVICPSVWPYMLMDQGPRGRLVRAMTWDGYILPKFLGSLPALTFNYTKRRILKIEITRPRA